MFYKKPLSFAQSFRFLHHCSVPFADFQIQHAWRAGRESNPDLQLRTLLCCSLHHPSTGTRAGNPTRISSLGPKRHHALDHASTKWKGCRELNSDLKVRSLAPSIRWTTSPICWKALPDSNRHSELRRLWS